MYRTYLVSLHNISGIETRNNPCRLRNIRIRWEKEIKKGNITSNAKKDMNIPQGPSNKAFQQQNEY